MWERLSLPIGCIRRERPSTPSAPYGLTRPVVPPDGSFISGTGFVGRSCVACGGLGLADRRFFRSSARCRDISSRLPKRNYRDALRNVAMLPYSLTVNRADNFRIFADFFDRSAIRSFTHWTTRKFSTEYPCHVQL